MVVTGTHKPAHLRAREGPISRIPIASTARCGFGSIIRPTRKLQRLLEDGRFASIRDLAEAEQVGLSYVSRILRLNLLAPDIVERILDGRGMVGLAVLLKPFAMEWDSQREHFC